MRPVKQLSGFKRVELMAGETATVTFELSANMLGFYNRRMQFVVEPGFFDVMIGASSDDIRLSGRFRVTGQIREMLEEREFFSKTTIVKQLVIGGVTYGFPD